MEIVLEALGTVGRALLGGLFVFTPGMILWLMVLGLYLGIRRVTSNMSSGKPG